MRTWSTALIVSGTFLVASLAYLGVSDMLTMEYARDPAEYQRMQFIKGAIYMVVTAAGLFVLTFGLLRRIKRQWITISDARESLMSVDRHVLAGTLAASVVHDINNLVGVMKANLQYLQNADQLGPEEREALDDSLEVANELASLNQRIRATAKREMNASLKPIALDKTLDHAIEIIRTHQEVRGCEVECSVPDNVELEAAPELLTHAVVNLVLNAGQATEGKGRIHVRVDERDEQIAICVDDDGPGIPEEQREELLEPFRTRRAEGSGLGLFSVAYAARHHNGRVNITDSPLGGARVEILIPR